MYWHVSYLISDKQVVDSLKHLAQQGATVRLICLTTFNALLFVARISAAACLTCVMLPAARRAEAGEGLTHQDCHGEAVQRTLRSQLAV